MWLTFPDGDQESLCHHRARAVKGTANTGPDALLRAAVSMPTPDDELGEDQDADSIHNIITSNVHSIDINLRLDAVRSAIDADHEDHLLLDTVWTGVPNTKAQLQLALDLYWALRDSLSIDDRLVVYVCRLVSPAPMRKGVLNMLHANQERTTQRARKVVYWPGLKNDIVNITLNCQPCQRELPSQPSENYVAHENATRPFQKLSMDFATYAGRQILVAVDHYSSLTWVFVFPIANSRLLVGAVRDVFYMFGAPDVIWLDNGPQFSPSRFQQFCREWGMSHRTSFPRCSRCHLVGQWSLVLTVTVPTVLPGVGHVASHFVSPLPPVERPRRSFHQIDEETL